MALSRKAARSERATKEAAPRPPNIKRITLDLPEELQRAIKLNAVKEGVTMAQKLRALLIDPSSTVCFRNIFYFRKLRGSKLCSDTHLGGCAE
jgi:hypothetical protein